MWFAECHRLARWIVTFIATRSNIEVAWNATGLPGGSLRSLLHGATSRLPGMPPACPVDRYVPRYGSCERTYRRIPSIGVAAHATAHPSDTHRPAANAGHLTERCRRGGDNGDFGLTIAWRNCSRCRARNRRPACGLRKVSTLNTELSSGRQRIHCPAVGEVPLYEDVKSADFVVRFPSDEDVTLHWSNGSHANITDFQPHSQTLDTTKLTRAWSHLAGVLPTA